MDTVRNKIRTFIFNNFLFNADEADLEDDASFLQEGTIDSTGILELVAWIEETFSITVEDEEFLPENLDSVNLLVQFIEKKTAYSKAPC